MDTVEPVPVIIIEGILIFYFPEIRVRNYIDEISVKYFFL